MSAHQPLVALSDISVRIYERSLATSLKRTLLRRDSAAPVRAIAILQEINLRVVPGERIGIVGRNGAGKTSLLKLIAGIYPPASGIRQVQGTLAPLISLGAGFAGELTLRENIRLGLVHAGRYHHWSSGFERTVLEFAELEARADEPFKVLSSGNQARLAFAIMLFQEPDILLLDEAFATGDFEFYGKARAAMARRVLNTPISIFVSHDEAQIREICNRCVLLVNGRIECDGAPDDVIREYHRWVQPGAPVNA